MLDARTFTMMTIQLTRNAIPLKNTYVRTLATVAAYSVQCEAVAAILITSGTTLPFRPVKCKTNLAQ